MPVVSVSTVAREWTRIGCIGFGGPPTHIALLRRLCVDERRWMAAPEFEDGVATTNLLPGPASTQLAIYCAWRLRGALGATIGGACFILPGLILILGLSALFLTSDPPAWVLGAAAGGGAAVPVVALNAAASFVPGSWARIGRGHRQRARWILYAVAGATVAATVGTYLVLVLVTCGLAEVMLRRRPPARAGGRGALVALVGHGVGVGVGSVGALAWVALKVGALSYGGGFVIIPLMQHDAVTTYHWMTGAQFLNAVALGQVTPGPVVQTVAVVGYAADGITGGLLAALIAFAPSFAFVLLGAPRFHQIRSNATVQSFLTGAGPAVVGAIAGSAIPLALALGHGWQFAVLALAAVWLLVFRRGVVSGILGAAAVGAVAALLGASVGN